MYGDKCGEFACGYWGFAWIMVRNRKVSFEIKWTKRSLELTEVIWSEAFPPPRIPSLWVDVLRLPFVWKTRKFWGEVKWNGSSRWKFSGKKSNTFRGITFSRFCRNDRSFLYHLSGLLLTGFMSRESEKFTGILQMVQLNPVPVFGAKKYQYHLTEIFHRNFRTYDKRT